MITRFDPFRDFDLFRDLDRFFERPSMSFGNWSVAPMDAVRSEDAVVLHVDLPGMDPKDVEVTVEGNVLTVTAERTWELGDGEEAIVRERRHGRVRRQVQLADNLDGSKVSASWDNGVLTIRVPVAEQAQPRRVEIDVRGDAVEAAALDKGTETAETVEAKGEVAEAA